MDRASDAFRVDDEDALVAHYLPRLRLFALRRLRDVSHAEDAAQETLRRALVALRERRVRDLQALPAYIYEIARHVCAEMLRNRERLPSAEPSEVIEGVHAPNVDPLSALITSERLGLVRKAIAGLSSEDRELLRLTYEEELSSEEIGRRLGLSPVNVRVRRHRLHAAIHQAVTTRPLATPERRER
jgi:RNA polymerase sigma-70 factor (ECF subfamily)